jgi:hypothetical protein
MRHRLGEPSDNAKLEKLTCQGMGCKDSFWPTSMRTLARTFSVLACVPDQKLVLAGNNNGVDYLFNADRGSR